MKRFGTWSAMPIAGLAVLGAADRDRYRGGGEHGEGQGKALGHRVEEDNGTQADENFGHGPADSVGC